MKDGFLTLDVEPTEVLDTGAGSRKKTLEC